MCSDKLITFLLNRKGCMALSITLLMTAMFLFSCGTAGTTLSNSTIEHRDGDMNLYRHTLALRFAPRLYLHSEEPYEIIGIIPVFHPAMPIIAYHIFFEEEIMPNFTKLDHEILWVEYDPVTLKVSDVSTLWHRTVLRTDTCLMDAKASQQRPTVFIQWGQHGILPLGWKILKTARPRAELRLHHKLASSPFSRVIFQGSYLEYVQFTKEVDASYYVKNQEIIVAEYSEELRSIFKQKFDLKKEWPWWSPR